MSYVTQLLLVLTSQYAIKTEVHELLERLWSEHRETLEQIVLKFLTRPQPSEPGLKCVSCGTKNSKTFGDLWG
jgi:hypothetical protein